MLSFLYVYSDHSFLECYNLFSGVELSMRSFFVIIIVIGFIYYQYTKISHTNQTTDVKLKYLNNKFPFYSIAFSFTYLGRKKISPTSHGKDKFNRGNCKLIKDTNKNIGYGYALVSILAFK